MNGSRSAGLAVRLFWLKDVLLAVCVKMCGKCWLTHHCCRHMETQQIRLEGCPGSLLSPHRYLPPGGTWAGSRSSSQGCPGCPWLLTSEPEQRIGDNCVCPSLIPPRALGVYESLVSGLSLKGCRAKSTDRPNQTLPVQTQKCLVLKMSSRIHASSLKIISVYNCFNGWQTEQLGCLNFFTRAQIIVNYTKWKEHT